MLIQALFGGGEDDEDDKKNPLFGLAALAMLSAFDQTTGRFSYFRETSQASQSASTSSSSAVQATSYQRASGSATSGGSSLGGSLDVTG